MDKKNKKLSPSASKHTLLDLEFDESKNEAEKLDFSQDASS